MVWYIQVCVTQFCCKNKICAGTGRFFKCSVMSFYFQEGLFASPQDFPEMKGAEREGAEKKNSARFLFIPKKIGKRLCVHVWFTLSYTKALK